MKAISNNVAYSRRRRPTAGRLTLLVRLGLFLPIVNDPARKNLGKSRGDGEADSDISI